MLDRAAAFTVINSIYVEGSEFFFPVIRHSSDISDDACAIASKTYATIVV